MEATSQTAEDCRQKLAQIDAVILATKEAHFTEVAGRLRLTSTASPAWLESELKALHAERRRAAQALEEAERETNGTPRKF